ncbi:MAG: right-handed parallel beta-helix repeat-containing protein [Solirubrobacteraceae bacterium]
MRSKHLIAVAPLAAVLALALPALASAAGVYVSNSNPVGSGTSCASPGYATIQAALAAGGTKINVCGGTYTEQLEITKAVKLQLASGAGTARVVMPATPADSLTSCDTAAGVEPGQKDEISICTAETVSISGLVIEAVVPLETCAGGLYGIFVAGGGTLNASNDTIVGASTSLNAFKGCQHGVALEVGLKTPAEVGHANLKNVNVSGYEKNGPTVKSAGSTLTIKSSTVTGEGPSPYIAQNGIEVAYGAKGSVSGTTVSGNECELSGVCSATTLGEQATGVLFYGAASGSGVTSSTFTHNDIGAYYASTSPTAPSSPEVSIADSEFTNNRYEGILLEEGNALVKGDKVNGSGRYGLALNQLASEPYAPGGEAERCTIEGMSKAGVVVFSDKQPGDPAGKFTLKMNSIEKNAVPVINESSNYTLVN